MPVREGRGTRPSPQPDPSSSSRSRPTSLAAIRKERERQQTLGLRTAASLATGAAATGAALLAALYGRGHHQPASLEQRAEALRVLRNDGLEPSDANVRLALRLVGVATQPYDDRHFRTLDPGEWEPGCATSGRRCGHRPEVRSARRDEEGREIELLELYSGDANVWLLQDFVSEEDGAHLLGVARSAHFSTSPTQRSEGQDWRSSSSAVLPLRGDEVARRVAARAAAVCGVPRSFVEDLQLVRYRPGEQYKPHLDSDGPDHRHWTLLLYLNDPGGGGATGFPLLGLKVLPSPRAAVFWENLRRDANVSGLVRNYYTLHDGQAPSGQEPKFAVNIWVRNAEYKPAAAA